MSDQVSLTFAAWLSRMSGPMPEYAVEHPQANSGAAARGQRLGNPAMSTGTQEFLTGLPRCLILTARNVHEYSRIPLWSARRALSASHSSVYPYIPLCWEAPVTHDDVCMIIALGVLAGAGVMDGAPGKKPDFDIRMSGFPQDDGRCVCLSSVTCHHLQLKACRGLQCAVALKMAVSCAASTWQPPSPWTKHPKVCCPQCSSSLPPSCKIDNMSSSRSVFLH